MDGAGPYLSRFVASLHRRLLLVRMIEWAGLGVLFGSLAASVVVGVSLWQERSAISVAVVFLSIGVTGGLVWAWVRRPTALAAANAADEQLRLSDLLSTAFSIPGQGMSGNCFYGEVLAQAEARCRSLAPSQIRLTRLGGGSWGAVSVSLLVLSGLCLLSWHPLESDPAGAALVDRLGATLPGTRTVFAGAKPDGGSGSMLPDHPMGTGENQSADSEEEMAGKSRRTDGNSEDGGSGQGGGPGSSQTGFKPSVGPANRGGTGSSAANEGGDTASGVGISGAHVGGHGAGGTSAAGIGRSGRVPAWQSAQWPEIVERAGQSVRSGQVPAAYQDLVRKYFEPE